ncbi:OmpA family protein [Mailhella massiliensis]|uniref:OmpA family protein n=1 Tax=Mailhella massiliensis TaxID=1903261 RepID=UPI00097D8D14|nr:OmpA family protein [Mailhella massiliensis]
MKTFRHALFAAALVMGIASAAQAADLVRKVDSFDLLADQSGSMMMKSDTFKMTKAAAAKQVLAAVNEAIPDLGYKASLHTVAPAGRVVAYGDWDRSAMAEGIASLEDAGAVFGRMTPMGDGLAVNSGDYASMARPTAIVLASDGANNLGVDPVAEAAAIYQAQPGICFHIISFADTEEGQAVLDKIAGLNSCSVSVKGADLMADQNALNQFVADVFYTGAAAEEALVLHGVNFAFDSYALDAKAQGILDEAAAVLKEKNVHVTLEGWTDSIGTDAYNKVLSQNRANTVKAYLVEQGVPASKLTAIGMGKSFKYDNATEEGRYLNRRVELLFN